MTALQNSYYLSLKANLLRPSPYIGNIDKIILTCEGCLEDVEISVLKPVMLCTRCNTRLQKHQILTDDYVKTERFKNLVPNAWKYLYTLFPNLTTSSNAISLDEGNTPLRISKIGTKLFNLNNLLIKDETRNPTGTFMDRGTTAEMTAIKLMDMKNQVICAMIGELAVSIAAYSARADFPCEIIIPRGEEWKLAPHRLYQMISYGAKISFMSQNFKIPYDKYYLIRSNNTLFFEGLKTTGFEICDQLQWHLPDRIIIPVGSGTHLYAIYRAIKELVKIGLVKNEERRKVKLHGVIMGDTIRNHNMVKSNMSDIIMNGITTTTIAPELAPLAPSHLERALSAIQTSKGSLIEISDADLINSVSLLASHEGIFASPAGASSLAGLLKLIDSNIIYDCDESIVCIVTGSGGMDSIITNWKQLESNNRMKQLPKEDLLISYNKNDGDLGSKILNGSTKMKILLYLNKKPDYVYSIHNCILHSEVKQMDISTLYQHLNELERMGLVRRLKAERYKGRPIRFYYSLTRSGENLVTNKR